MPAIHVYIVTRFLLLGSILSISLVDISPFAFAKLILALTMKSVVQGRLDEAPKGIAFHYKIVF